jgi:hypothetical protein
MKLHRPFKMKGYEARGKRDTRMGTLTRTYKELSNLAKWSTFPSTRREYKDIKGGLDSNMNPDKLLDSLNTVLFKRNHVDVSCCSVEFHQLAHNRKVFLFKANDNKQACWFGYGNF